MGDSRRNVSGGRPKSSEDMGNSKSVTLLFLPCFRTFECSGGLILLFFSDKHCNNPPRLYGDEPKVFEEIFRSVEKSGYFLVPVLLDSKSYCRVFISPGSRASRTEGDNLPSGEAPSSSSDVGESLNPHEQARRESPSRNDSVECLASIRTELRKLLPHIPDLTLLRWSRGKVLDPILDRLMNAPSSSSNPSSESCSDSSLLIELESDGIAHFFFLGDDYFSCLIRTSLCSYVKEG